MQYTLNQSQFWKALLHGSTPTHGVSETDFQAVRWNICIMAITNAGVLDSIDFARHHLQPKA
ncbi:MAG TPA: hypothetical protein ENH56_18020 [Roseobacter sp.]|uniref:Uncharacterized protein n=1 Tax=marine sediment metagenome TaxID=412755 RepID=A0A0F9RUY1_9ZZZZ|nr:hypothetical protein [Roseobacter sp.]